MADRLDQMFRRYTDAVRSKLQKRSDHGSVKGSLLLFVNETIELRAVVDELENEAEFRQLVLETRSKFSGDYHGKSEGAWQHAVKNFFRRTAYYLEIFEGKTPSFDAISQSYIEAFKRREARVSYLAPMEFVRFAEGTMDFKAFQVRQFTADELNAISQNTVREVFYPWAVLDAKRLQNYWFVYLAVPAPVPKIGRIQVEWSQLHRVGIEYTAYPKAIESALQQLALFDWQADWWRGRFASGYKERREDLERGWLGFGIPFVFKVDDYLLSSPDAGPDLSSLETEPFVDARTGEEVGEVPVTYVYFNKGETDAFQGFIERTGDLLGSVRATKNGWHFLEVGLGYFIKAFFAEGLEQILWHITALEALMGEKAEGVTERLARRIASILGNSENERKAIKKRFRELYDFRCHLVHGNPFQKQTYLGHLRDARNLARGALLWFLHYLAHIHGGIPRDQPAQSVATREDILTLIDLDQTSRVRLGWLIDSLPDGFPYVSEWVE